MDAVADPLAFAFMIEMRHALIPPWGTRSRFDQNKWARIDRGLGGPYTRTPLTLDWPLPSPHSARGPQSREIESRSYPLPLLGQEREKVAWILEIIIQKRRYRPPGRTSLSLSATQKNIIHHFAQLLDHPRNKDQALLYTQNTAVFICLFGEFYRVREEPGLEIFQEETTHQPALFSYLAPNIFLDFLPHDPTQRKKTSSLRKKLTGQP